MPSKPLILWRFRDGKPGHEKQTLGLALALAKLGRIDVHDIDSRNRWRDLYWWLRGIFPPGAARPRPDLLLVAGRGTHFAGLAARRAHGGKLVAIMRPGPPTAWFDLCLIPEHDAPAKRGDIVPTRGALNAVQPGGEHAPERGLMLIGGPSDHYAWDEARVVGQVWQLAEQHPDMRWRLTTSRRTPASFVERLRAGHPANIEVYSHTQTPAGWLEGALAESSQAWVTEDSVSMIYEALTSGCHVGLFRLPRKKAGRVARGVEKLIADAWVTPFEDARAGVCATPPRGVFNESERCARLILDRWFPNAD